MSMISKLIAILLASSSKYVFYLPSPFALCLQSLFAVDFARFCVKLLRNLFVMTLLIFFFLCFYEY